MYPTRLCVCVCVCVWVGERRGGGESGLSWYLQRAKYFVLLRNFLNFVSVIILPVHASAAEFHHLFCVSVVPLELARVLFIGCALQWEVVLNVTQWPSDHLWPLARRRGWALVSLTTMLISSLILVSCVCVRACALMHWKDCILSMIRGFRCVCVCACVCVCMRVCVRAL